MEFWIGSYTSPILFGTGETLHSKGAGISRVELDAQNKKLKLIKHYGGVDNPSYLAQSYDGKFLYCVNELKYFEEQPSGGVSAFAISQESGDLLFLSSVPSLGTDPCHLAVNQNNTMLFVANFMSGSVSAYPIRPDGSLLPASDFHQHAGNSLDKHRQAGPHAHSICFDGNETRIFIPDLGLDELVVYDIDAQNGKLSNAAIPNFRAVPGSGPRHCVFSDDERFLYLINELASSISCLSYDRWHGFTHLQTVSTLSEGFAGSNICADIHLAPDGRFLYASNRGENTIVSFARDQNTGALALSSRCDCGGRTPRNFAIAPEGDFLIVANQDTDTLALFEIDEERGSLSECDRLAIGTPVCVKFYKQQ